MPLIWRQQMGSFLLLLPPKCSRKERYYIRKKRLQLSYFHFGFGVDVPPICSSSISYHWLHSVSLNFGLCIFFFSKFFLLVHENYALLYPCFPWLALRSANLLLNVPNFTCISFHEIFRVFIVGQRFGHHWNLLGCSGLTTAIIIPYLVHTGLHFHVVQFVYFFFLVACCRPLGPT